jgi:N-acetylmuramoyl-L-alanine amidase
VHQSTDPARLKAKMLRAAVQDNADTIADRVPKSLRPAQRLLALAVYWGRVLLLPAVIVTSTLVAHWTLAAQPVTDAVSTPDLPAQVPANTTPPSAPDLSLLTRPLRPHALALAVQRVVLDAGHGGSNGGTSSETGLHEKDVTLDLAQRARQLLEQRGFAVVMTRTGDDTLSLKQRATTANEQRGDIFVSIHLNSFVRAGVRGVETFYLGPSEHPDLDAMAAAENQQSGYSLADLRDLLDGIYVDARRDESKRLAQSVQDAVMRRLGKSDPELEDRGVKTAPFVVLVATGMPAILAEVSCLSNRDEAERLATAEHRDLIAEALVSGIQSFSEQKTQLVRKRKDTHER